MVAEVPLLRADLRYLYKFRYQAAYDDVGSEHELCWVYAGTSADPVRANANEIAAWRYIAPGALDREMSAHPERFTPWMKLEWTRIRQEFYDSVIGT